jgi:hypothetical protein
MPIKINESGLTPTEYEALQAQQEGPIFSVVAHRYNWDFEEIDSIAGAVQDDSLPVPTSGVVEFDGKLYIAKLGSQSASNCDAFIYVYDGTTLSLDKRYYTTNANPWYSSIDLAVNNDPVFLASYAETNQDDSAVLLETAADGDTTTITATGTASALGNAGGVHYWQAQNFEVILRNGSRLFCKRSRRKMKKRAASSLLMRFTPSSAQGPPVAEAWMRPIY